MQSALACAVLLASGASAEWVDVYKRLPPGALAREMAAQSAPAYPFKNFSAAYVKKALSQPINWTALGAVTPVKDQGEHGYCGTFGRVGACEGQLAIKKGLLVSLAEEELIDCIGWDQDQVRKGASPWIIRSATHSPPPPPPGSSHTSLPMASCPHLSTPTTRQVRTWTRPSRGTLAATTGRSLCRAPTVRFCPVALAFHLHYAIA